MVVGPSRPPPPCTLRELRTINGVPISVPSLNRRRIKQEPPSRTLCYCPAAPGGARFLSICGRVDLLTCGTRVRTHTTRVCPPNSNRSPFPAAQPLGRGRRQQPIGSSRERAAPPWQEAVCQTGTFIESFLPGCVCLVKSGDQGLRLFSMSVEEKIFFSAASSTTR